MILYSFLGFFESALAALTIVLGGIVEGYGYGLSLGTRWPYTHNILELAVRGDFEAIHRILATIVGLVSLFLLIFDFNMITIVGFISVVFTALLGLSTLYVLAGKLPSIFQGFHDIAAYTTFVVYFLLGLGFSSSKLLEFLINAIIPPHFLYFVLFIGGTVTGLRKMREKIGEVIIPENKIQWAWAIHGIAVVIFLISLILLKYWIPLILTIIEVVIGMLVYRSINKNPTKPGISVGLHQLISIIIVVSLILYTI
ncbi:MAG: cytochrome C oxidase assembly protein [Sulfolobaceae archaeon]|nr:cytochrome C oxidase assembly protein [Sulfolobaceae archaeon]